MVDINKIKFQELGIPERKVLLSALGYNLFKLRCQFCKKKVDYKKCGILPSTDKRRNATITCDSPLCMSEYLDKMEDKK